MVSEDVARAATRSRPYRWLVTAGLIGYGVVHLLVAWIAVQIAWGGSSEEASPQGALRELADKPFGGVLLWAVAIGFFGLTLWQVSTLIFDEDRRFSAAGRSVLYLVLGILSVRVAMGSGGGGGQQQQTASARLMSEPAGRILVVLIGAGVLAIGVRHGWKAVTKKFTEDLTGGVPNGTVRLGQIGYAAKGVALGIVGVLFAWAAIDYDPEKAGGLDTALRTIREQPFGQILLTLMALGIACFGVYCFIWSRHARR
jgi:hypothetical protein